MWREASEHVHIEYERLTGEEKAEHKRLFSDYRYRPMKEDKERLKEARKKIKELEHQEKNTRRHTQKKPMHHLPLSTLPHVSRSETLCPM